MHVQNIPLSVSAFDYDVFVFLFNSTIFNVNTVLNSYLC